MNSYSRFSPFGLAARIILPLGVFLLVLMFVLMGPGSQYKRHIQVGNNFYSSGNYASAVLEYTEALKVRPNDRDGLLLRAMGYYRMNRYQRAIDDNTSALKTTRIPEVLASVYYNRGLDYEALNKLKEAIDDYSAAIQIQPRNFDAIVNRADCYRKSQQPDKAITDITYFLKIGAPTFFAYYVRGISYEEMKKWKESAEDLKSALKLKPTEAQAWGSLGWAQYMSGDLDAAVATDRKALNMQPKMSFCHFNLALCLAVQKNWDSASQEYQQSLTRATDADKHGALEDVRAAIRLHPGGSGSALAKAEELLVSAGAK